ncbi:Ice2p NDAI_0B03520 [Naumovozyma dairenensis CBS 421]|uniref:Uncharacterized protein n=1 Tax=Naumovozyma dairenensis (strain ATCC 10597 / BCRC 20456 / CBS 421 / NBRC 0211 / NRRL Y-12639) TaxID=1071378 RepID=G0W6H5_NAUDC|nr:hypothetical protein NDAI_0B03520 [Naumovozyma dairenensis CBS 421]CCD23386.1 hypothetical protein NDAI_0B03520 [Naumovozyma dairenensis CBS 421]
MISSSFMRGVRTFSAAFYLLFTLISIPISFKIGGLQCGLAFTATLFTIYFLSTTLSLLARKYGSNFSIFLTGFLYYSQHLIIASLLYLFLSGFSHEDLTIPLSDDTQKVDIISDVVRRNLSSTNSNWNLYHNYYTFFVQPWKYLLSYSTPFFTLSEGFFTILAIQAVGETNKWLVNEINSNTWIISSLLTSGGVITASLYYLYRIYVTPIWQLSIQTASLLGFTLSLVGGLGLYGIVTEKGSVIESSLFFAYIVRCIYEISPKLATTATDEILEIFKEVWQRHQGNLPTTDNLLFYYNNFVLRHIDMLWELLVSKINQNDPNNTLPSSFNINFLTTFLSKDLLLRICKPIWKLFKNFTVSVPSSISELVLVTYQMARESVSPAVVINLCFRVLIFYSATRIIPALQRRNDSELKKSRRIMKILYWYSPCVLIAMYTHLILQYSGELKKDLCLWGCNLKWLIPNQPELIVDSWGFWNWCNIFFTIIIYASELFGTTATANKQ